MEFIKDEVLYFTKSFFDKENVPYLFIMIIAIVFYGRKKIAMIKVNSKKKKLISNNNYVKINRKKLDEIINSNSYFRIFAFLGIIAIIVIIILMMRSMIISQTINIFSILLIFVFIGIIVLINNGYKNYFKNEVVGKIIKQYNNSLNYTTSGGFTKEEYDNCCFIEVCDKFISNDYIYDDNSTFKYADITTYSVSEDSDGRSKTLSYSGSLICTSIKNVNCKIFFGSMAYYLSERVKNMKINMENNEFNDVLEAYTDNELEAYKLLTPSVMNRLVEVYNSTYTDFDIRIFNNTLYIRFFSGDSFEPSLFSKKREKNSIYSSIAAFEEAIIVMNKVKAIIDNTNIQGG